MDSKVSPFIQTAGIEQNAEGHLALVAKTIALRSPSWQGPGCIGHHDDEFDHAEPTTVWCGSKRFFHNVGHTHGFQ